MSKVNGSSAVANERSGETLPEHWEWTSMGEIASIVGGSTPRSKEATYWDGDIPWLAVSDLTDYSEKFIAGGARSITQAGYSSCSTQMVPQGTVLFSSRAPIGYVAIAGRPLCTSQGFKSFVLPEMINSEYIYWYLRSAKSLAESLASGTTFKELSGKRATTIPVPLPPRAEQDRIVEALERGLETIDVGVGELEVSQHKLANLQTAILTRFTSAQTRAKIIDVGEVYVGATPSREDPEFWNGDIPWVSSGEVAFCRISSTRESITEAGLGNRARRLHPPGTLLLAMIGEGKTRGQAAILDVAAAHNQNSAAIRLNPAMMLPEFLYFCLLLQYERNRRQATGSSQPALNKTRVEQLDVPCPSLAEQRSAVEAIRQSLTVLHQQEQDLERENNLASALKRGVLGRAFSGRLVPQSPTDEPASELLGQVRRQRKSTSGNRRKSVRGLS